MFSNETLRGSVNLVRDPGLAHLKGAAFELRFDASGRAVSFTVAGPDIVKSAKTLIGQSLSGELTDGRYLIVELDDLITPPAPGASNAVYRTGSARILEYKPAGHAGPAWVYRIVNLRIRICELKSIEVISNGYRFQHDTIRFKAGGRIWYLKDSLHGPGNESRRDFLSQSEAVVSGLLWTSAEPGDIAEKMDALATDIVVVLSLAQGRCVRWYHRCYVDELANTSKCVEYPIWAAPASAGDNEPIANEPPGSIAAFLEQVHPVYAKTADDREWFHRTLEIYLQSVISPVLDVKLVFLNVLMERIATRVVGTKFGFQIDDKLADRADEVTFRADLHKVLSQLSHENWTEDRTGAVIGTIKGWNKQPSLPVRVQMAAKTLGLRSPNKDLVTPRNPTLHEGEIKHKFGSLADYWTMLDGFVLSLILRTLGYDGVVFHHALGTGTVRLKDMLEF